MANHSCTTRSTAYIILTGGGGGRGGGGGIEALVGLTTYMRSMSESPL